MHRTLRTLVALVATLASTTALAAEDWLAQSNANAQPLLEILVRYAPEQASALGVEGHDEEIFDLKPRYDERFEADVERVAADLESRIATTSDPRVKQDLRILVQAAREQVTTSRLNRQYMLPWFDVNETLFRSLQNVVPSHLMDPKAFDFAALGANNGRIIGIEGYAVHRALVDDEHADVDAGVRARMLLARTATDADYAALLAERRAATAEFAAWMRGRDALLTPMLPITARAVSDVDETTYPLATWSRAVNYLDGCAIAIPAGLSASGLPIGMQLVGASGADNAIAGLGKVLEKASGENRLRPPAP